MWRTLDAAEFAGMVGRPPERLPAECHALLEHYDFAYRLATPTECDRAVSLVLGRIAAHDFSEAGPEGLGRWERGWGENLARFQAADSDLSALMPAYIRPQWTVRLHGQFVVVRDPSFEAHWYEVFQGWLFREFFANAPIVYEFGCGSGINLAKLASIYPEKRYVGLDWAEASRAIVDSMSLRYDWNMEGRLFDFFHPDETLEIEAGAVVFTLGALEQTGQEYGAFLDYLLRFKPALCVHIEPVVEWYGTTVEDYTAIRFHNERRYWTGFVDRLLALAVQGRVEIIKMKRAGFGSLYIEGYSQIIWRPL